MDDRDQKISKPGMPPLPPGFIRPNQLQPSQAGRPPLPPGAPQFPSFGQAPFPPNFPQSARDAGADESGRIKEEKDKLEKKITDMEKLLSQEKEKALLATLKNQQDEALSSRVESSLKDIQEKMRRDRRDHEVEEERLSLKSKIKEMEMRLAQERETWMQTLKNQMSERETQGRDVEGHFVYRLQEMERRWLDEKAQWQKEIVNREETIRSLRSAGERLQNVEDELRKLAFEKSMTEREASKLRDEVARGEREKAGIESYIKMIPEKEREIADLRSECVSLRSREELTRLEVVHRDEKYNSEIGRLQAELGTISDRKNTERNEELVKVHARFEAQLQEKDGTIAEISGEKVRAISELVKIRGFVSRVQAINAVLDKERGQLKLDKMQLAQNMAAQLEELRRLKQESDALISTHQAEIKAQTENFKAEISRVKNGFGAELACKHAEEMAEVVRARQEETSRLVKAHQEEIASLAATHQAEIASLAAARQEEASRQAAARQEEISKMTAAQQEEMKKLAEAQQENFFKHSSESQDEYSKAAAGRQAELARMAAGYQAELAKMAADYQAGLAAQAGQAAERQTEFDAKISQMRQQYEASLREETDSIRRQFELAQAGQMQDTKAAASAALASALRLEIENRRLAAVAADADKALIIRTKDLADRLERAEAEALKQETHAASSAAQKAGLEKAAREAGEERQRIAAEYAALRAMTPELEARRAAAEAEAARLAKGFKDLEGKLRAESEYRARLESELLQFKQKLPQLEYQFQENENLLEAERASLANLQAAAAGQQKSDAARIEELKVELEIYKALEDSFTERLKWTLKGKKKE